MGKKIQIFFHASTMHRRNKKRTVHIKNDNGEWQSNQQAMFRNFQIYYQHLFESSSPQVMDLDGLITTKIPENNVALLNPISEVEVKRAVFGLGANKALGPDGLNGVFFQHSWETIKEEVVGVIQSFFSTGSLPNEVNLFYWFFANSELLAAPILSIKSLQISW